MGVHVHFDPEDAMPPGLAKKIRAWLEQRYAAVGGTVEVHLDYESPDRFRIVTAQHFDPGRASEEGKTDPMHTQSYVARVRADLSALGVNVLT
jgi:hypothetical protein